MPPAAVDDIFEVQKQIREGVRLLIDVAVAAHARRQTDALQELGDAAVCGGGEGADAVIAEERPLVEGVLQGDLGAPEIDGPLLPLLHLGDQGLDLGVFPGVELSAGGTGRLNALYGGEAGFAQDPNAQGPDQQGLFDRPGGIEQQQDEAHHGCSEGGDQHDRLPVNVQDLPEDQCARDAGKGDPPPADGVQLRIGAAAHIDDREAPQEAEPEGQHIREVEAVPDIVERPEQEAAPEEKEQQNGENTLPERNAAAEQIEDCKDQRDKAAGNVRQALHRGRHDAVRSIGQHLPEAAQRHQEGLGRSLELAQLEIQEHVVRAAPDVGNLALGIKPDGLPAEEFVEPGKLPGGQALGGGIDGILRPDVHVQGVRLREFVFGVGGRLQAQEGRNGQHGRHAQSHRRKEGELEQADPEAADVVPVDDVPADEDQQNEDADEEADIVAAPDGEKEAERIQRPLSLLQKGDGPGHDQGRQGDGIEPDRVPVVAHEEGAQRVGHGENRDRKLGAVQGLAQEEGEAQSGQTEAEQDGEVVPVHCEPDRQQGRDPVQRACQIVGEHGEIVDAHTRPPGMEQGVPLHEPLAQIQVEGIILVPLIVGKDHLIPEGHDLMDGPEQLDDQHRHEEGEQIDIACFARLGKEAAPGLNPAEGAAEIRLRHKIHLKSAACGAAMQSAEAGPPPGKARDFHNNSVYYTMKAEPCQCADFAPAQEGNCPFAKDDFPPKRFPDRKKAGRF